MSIYAGSVVVRARKMVRSRGRYQVCWRCAHLLDLDVDPWQVGHIVAQVDGGGHSPTNLAAEHARCNMSAGGKDGARRRRDRARANATAAQRLRRW